MKIFGVKYFTSSNSTNTAFQKSILSLAPPASPKVFFSLTHFQIRKSTCYQCIKSHTQQFREKNPKTQIISHLTDTQLQTIECRTIFKKITLPKVDVLSQVRRLEIIDLSPSDVIHHQRSRGSSVVAPCDSSEPLLSCCIPDLQFDFLATNFNYSCTKFNTNCVRTVSHNC